MTPARDYDAIAADDTQTTQYEADVLAATKTVAAAFEGANVQDDGGGPYIAFANYGVDDGSGSYPNGPHAFIINLGDTRPGFWQFQCGGDVVETYELTIDSPAPEVIAWLTDVLAADPYPTEDVVTP